jgi:ribosomal protein RSM22 (predicted rRNA methylase)
LTQVRLPAALERGIADEAAELDARRLARLASELSESYRARRDAASRRFVTKPEQALAYAAQLLPATYAQLAAAFAWTAARAGQWRPATMLDVGAGPGTAIWAAAEQWPDLRGAVALEPELAFVDLGRSLAMSATSRVVREASWQVGADLETVALEDEAFDLVVLGHVLGEIAESSRAKAVAKAWAACAGVLLIVEPGTPHGFSSVRAARDQLLALGAHTLSPCPHDRPCPLVDDWCHFAQRLQRPDVQRRARQASLPYEDAKSSHAAMARFPTTAPPWARVLRHPRHGKGRIDLELCTREGLVDTTVTHASAAWKRARRWEWGSALEGALE